MGNRRRSETLSVMHNLTYGLFVLTTTYEGKDNGCIINTAMQQTSTPNRISVTVNKNNFTCDMIAKSGVFNVNILSETAPFFLFQHFGFQSGKDAEKFAGQITRSKNGVPYITTYTCGVLSASVISVVDLGTHVLFIGDVVEEIATGTDAPVTYSYYHKNIKPQPKKEDKRGYVCRICGYTYEGDVLPEDFICPICKHGAEDFDRV